MRDDKSQFSLAFPTLVGKEPREEKSDTVVQTRGPWSMERSGDSVSDSIDDEFDLPDLPNSGDAAAHTMRRNTPTPPPSGSYPQVKEPLVSPVKDTPSAAQRAVRAPAPAPTPVRPPDPESVAHDSFFGRPPSTDLSRQSISGSQSKTVIGSK